MQQESQALFLHTCRVGNTGDCLWDEVHPLRTAALGCVSNARRCALQSFRKSGSSQVVEAGSIRKSDPRSKKFRNQCELAAKCHRSSIVKENALVIKEQFTVVSHRVTSTLKVCKVERVTIQSTARAQWLLIVLGCLRTTLISLFCGGTCLKLLVSLGQAVQAKQKEICFLKLNCVIF